MPSGKSLSRAFGGGAGAADQRLDAVGFAGRDDTFGHVGVNLTIARNGPAPQPEMGGAIPRLVPELHGVEVALRPAVEGVHLRHPFLEVVVVGWQPGAIVFGLQHLTIRGSTTGAGRPRGCMVVVLPAASVIMIVRSCFFAHSMYFAGAAHVLVVLGVAGGEVLLAEPDALDAEPLEEYVDALAHGAGVDEVQGEGGKLDAGRDRRPVCEQASRRRSGRGRARRR